MPNLVTSAENVMQNIDRYWEGAHETPDLIKDATRAKQWKCYKDIDGKWRFGPSRFVGYEGMTPNEYVARKATSEGGLDGTETEDHLKLQKWTILIPEDSKLHFKLVKRLSKFLKKSDKNLNAAARFAVLGADEEDLTIRDKNAEIVDALITLAAPLPEAYRQTLIRKLNLLEK